VERIADSGGGRYPARFRGLSCGRGETCRRVLRDARGEPHLADTKNQQKNSGEGNEPEYHGDRHLDLLKGQYSLSGDGCGVGLKRFSDTSSPSALQCSIRIGTRPVAVW